MDNFSNFSGVGSGVYLSQTVPAAPHQVPVSEPPKPSTEETLLKEIQKLNANQNAFRSEMDRKVSSLNDQNQLLRKTLEEELHKKNSTTTKVETPPLDNMWNNFFQQPSATPTVTPTQTQQKGNEEVTPEQIQKVVLDTLGQVQQTGLQAQQAEDDAGKRMAERFKAECPDLHNHAREVVELWTQTRNLRPDLSAEDRYKFVVNHARSLFRPSGSLPAESMTASNTRTEQGDKKMDMKWDNAAKAEMETERKRQEDLVDYVAERQRDLNRKRGIVLPS